MDGLDNCFGGGSNDDSSTYAAAPAPQAEGTSQTVTQCPKFAWCVMGHDHKGTCSSFHYELVGAAPAETARPRWECTCTGRDKKVWSADATCPIHGTAGETTGEMTAEQLGELIDRSKDDQSATIKIGLLRAYAKQRVEQAECLLTISAEALALEIPKVTELQAKVADLEREHRSLQKSYEDVWKRAEAAESELREMREALPGVLHVLNSAPKQGWDKWRNAVDAIERLLARKAGS